MSLFQRELHRSYTLSGLLAKCCILDEPWYYIRGSFILMRWPDGLELGTVDKGNVLDIDLGNCGLDGIMNIN